VATARRLRRAERRHRDAPRLAASPNLNSLVILEGRDDGGECIIELLFAHSPAFGVEGLLPSSIALARLKRHAARAALRISVTASIE